ncbi:hypothetical protein [Mycobacterium syngnathidarum]
MEWGIPVRWFLCIVAVALGIAGIAVFGALDAEFGASFSRTGRPTLLMR